MLCDELKKSCKRDFTILHIPLKWQKSELPVLQQYNFLRSIYPWKGIFLLITCFIEYFDVRWIEMRPPCKKTTVSSWVPWGCRVRTTASGVGVSVVSRVVGYVLHLYIAYCWFWYCVNFRGLYPLTLWREKINALPLYPLRKGTKNNYRGLVGLLWRKMSKIFETWSKWPLWSRCCSAGVLNRKHFYRWYRNEEFLMAKKLTWNDEGLELLSKEHRLNLLQHPLHTPLPPPPPHLNP